ncbi:TPA: hypothetical protein ACGD2U_003806, partial [Aeromonas veronii]
PAIFMGVQFGDCGSLGVTWLWWCSCARGVRSGEFTYCGAGLVGYSVNVRFIGYGLESVASSLVAAFSCSTALH